MSRVPSRDHPRDCPREGSQLDKRQRDPIPASRAALLQPAPRPADRRNVVVQVESSDSEADASVATEDPSDVEDPPRQSPQDLHYPEAASPSDDVHSFAEHIIKMSRALDIDLVYPEADAEDPVKRRVHGRVPTPPCVPFLPSLQTILKRSWDSPSSPLGPPRKIESLYKVAAPNAPWLMSHPCQNSAIVEGAQQTSTQRQTTSPVDKEAKKIDALAKKAYAAAALAAKASSYTACMGAYVQTLMEGISPIVPDVPDEVQRTLTEIRDETHSIGSWLITAARNVTECVGRAMSASIALRRHAWLRGSDLNQSVRSTIEDMPIDGSGLFHADTDERLNKKFRMKAAARKHGMSTPGSSSFRKRLRPWQHHQGQFQRSPYQERQFHQQGSQRQGYPSQQSSSSGRRNQSRYRKNRRQEPDQGKKRA
ncbi:uncharacterized protein LOC121918717 [Sceloporus undulatus]|uniref:uncharacterized protein LOC121918717 n=1 Tax=Sceloporus undulatus TaxID=8520 RepID=UPI001C4D3D75|nr:uncharacterized protein LOC121918717 [Sceloporus undulatus]